jgi:hypothetical protein
MSARRLRILFFAGGPRFYLRQYASLVSQLAERGHEIHLAFQPTKGLPTQLAEHAAAAQRVSYGVAPQRRPRDGWRSVAWLVRALPDLARYSHPRYARAPVLRERMSTKTLRHLTRAPGFEPIGRRLGVRLARRLSSTTDAELSERVIEIAARLEAAIPTDRGIDRYIREREPDVVLVTPLVNRASPQVEFLKSARRLGIPAGVCVASWDNLTNKGLIRVVPERVFVWNELQRREAVELHGVPEESVIATGAQLFDDWFERRPSRSRDGFLREVALDPSRPYVLYVCSNPAMTDVAEAGFVLAWIQALREGADGRLRRLGILIRPHPNEADSWREVDLTRFENVTVWPPIGDLPVTEKARADFYDSLAHSAAVVGINTTAMIEGAIVGKSVLTVLAPEFAQESTLHFHYLLEENGGFLHVAASLEDHMQQLLRVLDEDAADAERRRRFVESFVRPHGLDRPATPILAAAVEDLAAARVSAPVQLSTLLLRLPLALEAGLSSVAAAAGAAQVSKRLRRLRRRAGAQARRRLFLPRSEA